MSAGPNDVSAQVAACAINACWSQWRALGAVNLALGRRPADSIVDPEALILLTLSVRHLERRLEDRLRWWAEWGSALTSVQRMRTLLALYPDSLREAAGWYASLAVEAGDKRWRALLSALQRRGAGRAEKGAGELRLLEPATLLLRLRAGFGVGAKADTLAFLIGTGSSGTEGARAATAEVVSKGISYSIASVRRAASDMALSRLVDATAERPVRYSVDAEAWARLLRLDDLDRPIAAAGDGDWSIPRWRFWAQMFAFLAACLEFHEWTRGNAVAPVVAASRARDLFERYRRVLTWNGIEQRDPRMFPGERYLEAFAHGVASACSWIEERV